MIASLGFDSIIVNNNRFDDENLSRLYEVFVPCGIKNFIFLFDFNISINSISLTFEKIKNFKNHLSNLSPRGIHNKVFCNLIFDKGSSFNPYLNRLFAVKKNKSVFISLPLFTDLNYESIAQDLNNLVYRLKSFSILSNFDMVVETSSFEFSQKLLGVPNIGTCLDINYLFDPQKLEIANSLIKSKALFIPSVSRDILNYVGIMNEADFFLEMIGKKNYYTLCSHILKCSSKIGC